MKFYFLDSIRARGRSIIEGGQYSYMRVHKPWKQSISKETNEAESEFMNMGPLNY